MTSASPLTRRGDGIELALKVTPRAGRLAVEGIMVDAAGAAWLAVKVTAPPDDGRANAAVLALLAKQLGVPGSACRLVAGAASRWKRVHVSGNAQLLAGRAAALAGLPEGR